MIQMFACLCGAREEGLSDPPKCWVCGKQMYRWSERKADFAAKPIIAEQSDKRTANGGY